MTRAIQRSRHSEFSTRLSAYKREEEREVRRATRRTKMEREEEERKIMETSADEQVSTQLL